MKRKIKILMAVILAATFAAHSGSAQQSKDLADVPEFGAQVFIEPGQSPELIDHWFKLMKDNGMKLCRIRMFETYMHNEDGSWDFSLFDHAFRSAEKYDIKIFATLFPATSFMDIGGFKFPFSNEHRDSIADYIKNVTLHFRSFNSLLGWVLMNEPGSGSFPDGEFTQARFEEWLDENPVQSFNTKGYPILGFEKERFLVDYTTWYLKWIADEVKNYDPERHLHVNNHAIFRNIGEFDFPSWREFLTSLGGSAHASWHFNYFNRDQYGVAMSANCEIIRSGAGKLPWIMTEIQAGNNTYSSRDAMCPTKEEIAQWMWIIIGSGGKGGIFWTLNPRSSGFEAGEWSMINFLGEASDRLLTVHDVTDAITANAVILESAEPLETGINILYTRESLWTESALRQTSEGKQYEGRTVGGVMKSALAYLEAFSELGISANLKAIDEFDFTREDYNGVTVILANQIAIPSRNWKGLEEFVSKGGKLLVDGMTAFYDESAHCIMNTGFPLEKLFGGNVTEFKIIDNVFEFPTLLEGIHLTASTWMGFLRPTTGKSIAVSGNQVTGLRNNFGKGEVLWVPSLVGLGARMTDYKTLSALLISEISGSISRIPIRFAGNNAGAMMKTLKFKNGYLTVIINKNKVAGDIELIVPPGLKAELIYGNSGNLTGNRVHIPAEETLAIKWE